MKNIKFGRTDLKVSRVALGGIPIMLLAKKDAVKVVRVVINMGVNFIDTANGYGDSEEKIGEAIKFFKREKLVLSSKSQARSKKTFTEHIDLSLKRLNTNYIDIYHLHNISDYESFKQAMSEGGAYEALEEAVKKGKVRYYGFSAYSGEIGHQFWK